jgi:hypothetical protein
VREGGEEKGKRRRRCNMSAHRGRGIIEERYRSEGDL